MIFAAFILFSLALFMSIKPDWFWCLTESWKGNATEPSKSYLFSIRLAGIVLFILTILCIVNTYVNM